MYLSTLSKTQKELFLAFAYQLAYADGENSSIETEMIKAYCHEMNIEYDKNKCSKDMNEIINILNSICGEKEKRIIIFEAVGLALADDSFDEEEKNIISFAGNQFGLKKNFVEDCKTIIYDYFQLQHSINNLILIEN